MMPSKSPPPSGAPRRHSTSTESSSIKKRPHNSKQRPRRSSCSSPGQHQIQTHPLNSKLSPRQRRLLSSIMDSPNHDKDGVMHTINEEVEVHGLSPQQKEYIDNLNVRLQHSISKREAIVAKQKELDDLRDAVARRLSRGRGASSECSAISSSDGDTDGLGKSNHTHSTASLSSMEDTTSTLRSLYGPYDTSRRGSTLSTPASSPANHQRVVVDASKYQPFLESLRNDLLLKSKNDCLLDHNSGNNRVEDDDTDNAEDEQQDIIINSSSESFDDLASRACALACSQPSQYYTDLFPDGKESLKIDNYLCSSEDYESDDAQEEEHDDDVDDRDTHSLALAQRTSDIMSTFQDYLTEIEDDKKEEETGMIVPSIRAQDMDRHQNQMHMDSISYTIPTKSNDGSSSVSRGVVSYDYGNSSDSIYIRRGSTDSCCSWGASTTALHDVDVENGQQHQQHADENDDWYDGHGSNDGHHPRYKHPLLHSSKLKRGVFRCVLILVAICAVVGVTLHEKEKARVNHLENEIQEEENELWTSLKWKKEEQQKAHEDDDAGIAVGEYSGIGVDLSHSVPQQQQQTDDYYQAQDSPEDSNVVHVISTKDNEVGMIEEVIDHNMSSPSTSSSLINDEQDASIKANTLAGVPASTSNQELWSNEEVQALPTSEEETVLSSISSPHDYDPTWYDRSAGWKGRSYIDAIAFCASQESTIPCPYEVICPEGPGTVPTGGSRPQVEAWAPIMDALNSWASVGSSGTTPGEAQSCIDYNSRHSTPPMWGVTGTRGNEDETVDHTPALMCCKPPLDGVINSSEYLQASRHAEKDDSQAITVATPGSPPTVTDENQQKVLDKMHPAWFGRKEGYHGTTYEEAADFCKSVGDMHLCPVEAYCPDGPGQAKPLFLNQPAFIGEQWAPISKTHMNQGDNPLKQNKWVQVGTVNDVSFSTCMSHEQINGEDPQFGLDGSRTEAKEHVLCCENPNKLLKETNYVKHLDPIWLDESHGWNGGSHDEAMNFCGTLGNRKLCPYTAYCPHGPGQPVMGGHTQDFNGVGEQWAPIFGEMNHWVQIGRKFNNAATTCMDNFALEGAEPTWGLSDERREVKNHIMCCSYHTER